MTPSSISIISNQETVDQCVDNLKSNFDVLDVIYCDGNTGDVDFYVKVKKLHRPSYENNQRLVFVLTKDQFTLTSSGISLHNLQSIINDIDISNFFVCLVTTNPDILTDYQFVFDNFSQDPVPFHIHLCHGSWEKNLSEDLKPFSKYASIKDVVGQIENLRDDQKKLLFDSKTFCMLAWTGINIEPNNQVRPCCEFSQSLGDSSKDSLHTVWNADAWKKVRRDMLDGRPVSACRTCYEKEGLGRDTLRQSCNRSLISKIDLIDKTQDDGHLDAFHLSYWDVRYNNLCNLACRSCGPAASSSWYQPAVTIGQLASHRSPILIAGRGDNDIYEQIIEHVDHVKQIYFAGGEPSMIDKFYSILEVLDAHGRNDVKLNYNINMSRLVLKEKSLLHLWKKFPSVSVGASLDGENERGEYLRQGLKWQDVVANRRLMMQECPHVDFYISATVSILNVLHLPDFHRSWVDQDLIDPEDFNIQILFNPKYLRVDYSPLILKEKIKKVYQNHLDWLVSKDHLGRATFGFRSVLSYIQKEQVFDEQDFRNHIISLDQYHGTDIFAVFPELSLLDQ